MDVSYVTQCSGEHSEVDRLVIELLLVEVNLGEWSFQELQDQLSELSEIAIYYHDEINVIRLMKLVRDTLIHFGDGYTRKEVTLDTLANVARVLFSDVLSAFAEDDLTTFGLSGKYGISSPVVVAMSSILLEMLQYLGEMPFLRNLIYSFAECKFAKEFHGTVTMLHNISRFVEDVICRRNQQIIEVFHL